MAGAETEMSVLADGPFRAGTVLARTLSLLGRNIVPFLLLAAIARVPEFLTEEMMKNSGVGAGSGIGALVRPLLPSAIVTAVMSTLSTATILYLALNQMAGRPARIGEAIAATGVQLVPLLGISLLSLLGVFGIPLLIFVLSSTLLPFLFLLPAAGTVILMLIALTPGLILLVMWYVAVPVCLLEQRGVFQSLRRSSALTKGARLKLLMLVVLELALSYASGALGPDAVSSFLGVWGQFAVQFLLVSLHYAFTGVLAAMVYYELRMEKQGFDPVRRIAEIFD